MCRLVQPTLRVGTTSVKVPAWTVRPRPFNDPAWLFEPKYDGFRGMLYLTRQSCTLYSKRGNRMTRFQALAKA
jgi:ATP-dependent DNA ligase